MKSVLIALILVSSVYTQQKGTQTQEYHPKMSIQNCASQGSCSSESGQIVIDSNWRWTHKAGDYQPNCYTGNEWDSTLCSTVDSCTQNCAVDGISQEQDGNTYSVSSTGEELTLGFVTEGPYSRNVGSRVYLLESETKYKMFQLLNKEFTFDIDDSNLPCGLNGALYFVEMSEDGGMSEYPTNKIGAQYGAGYCDAQCPHDMKWINGEANVLDWVPSSDDPNAGTGKYGTCCAEMDIWEANSQSTQITPHSCSVTGQYRCSGVECGDNASGDRYNGVCDKDGCDFNPYRLGSHEFWGEGSGFTIDTTQKSTVVTQFITDDNTDTGNLVEIKRFYVQNGKVIPNSEVTVNGVGTYNSITQENCDAQKVAFGETNSFKKMGGMQNMGEALGRGMVLVMSIWDDHEAHMLWLDSTYPTDQTASDPGAVRGPCATSSGDPKDVESQDAKASVMFGNLKYGAINSTFSASSGDFLY